MEFLCGAYLTGACFMVYGVYCARKASSVSQAAQVLFVLLWPLALLLVASHVDSGGGGGSSDEWDGEPPW